jgi:putative transcriptional regulator
MSTIQNCAGQLLVAAPQLTDPNFAGSVVLILVHDDNGAFGLVLNDVATQVSSSDLVPHWTNAVTEPVLLGGPVQTDGLLGLGEPRGGIQHIDGFTLLGNAPQPLGAVDLSRDPVVGLARVRLFIGYSGWGPQQLDTELLFGGWVVVDAHPDDAFTSDLPGLWARALRRSVSSNDPIAQIPDDIRMN